jgi:hypothetical protein
MVVPAYGAASGAEVGGPEGYTYGAIVARGDDPRPALREIRFSGWVAPPEDGWQIAIPASGGGTIAAGRRGVVGAAEWLADRVDGTVLAIRVLRDRQLLLAAWSGGEELGRYVSDPSREPGADKDVLAEPLGAENATAFATACGHPEAGEDLEELLAEELDPDSVIESERLSRVLRLLGLPTWLVAAPTLPRDIPTGPRHRDLVRLGAGVPGLAGWLRGRAVDMIRKRRPPPPAVTDAPRGSSGMDPWLL